MVTMVCHILGCGFLKKKLQVLYQRSNQMYDKKIIAGNLNTFIQSSRSTEGSHHFLSSSVNGEPLFQRNEAKAHVSGEAGWSWLNGK